MHVHMLREASMNMSDSMPDFGSLPDFEISRFRTRQIPDKSQTNPRQIPYRKCRRIGHSCIQASLAFSAKPFLC